MAATALNNLKEEQEALRDLIISTELNITSRFGDLSSSILEINGLVKGLKELSLSNEESSFEVRKFILDLTKSVLSTNSLVEITRDKVLTIENILKDMRLSMMSIENTMKYLQKI